VLHTQLSFSTLNWTGSPDATTVRFGWRSVGQRLDQPAADFSGTPGALLARSPAVFPSGAGASIIVAGALGDGATGLGTPSSDGGTLAVTNLLAQPALKAPLTVRQPRFHCSPASTICSSRLSSPKITRA
jgi:hypothetical protein